MHDASKPKQDAREGEKINHLLFMDDLKQYGKSESEIRGLVSTVEVFSQDIGMKFGVKMWCDCCE